MLGILIQKDPKSFMLGQTKTMMALLFIVLKDRLNNPLLSEDQDPYVRSQAAKALDRLKNKS